MMEIVMRSIGVIHLPFTTQTQMAIEPSRWQAIGQVEVYAEFAEGFCPGF